MARTFIRQDTQIRKSDTYTDNTAPSEANFETNPVNIEDDLNNIRSQMHNLLKDQAGNWYDDLNSPSSFENGTQRGVNDLNTDLHELERKRLLRRRAVVGADISVPAAAAATGVLTLTGNAVDTETVTIGTKTYTFQATLTDVDGNVLIGATASDSLDNLIAAITLGAGSGTLYAASTTLHPTVTAVAGAGDTMDVTAKSTGTGGNSIATTETLTNGSWGAATLSGGAGDVVILGAGELPGNTTAAVGTVTTLGTVVAYEANFGTATLTDIAGGDALTPKNLCRLANATTGQTPLDSSGNEIHALLQSESNTDGHTITSSASTRVQLSFVIHNVTNDDLILVSADEIGGATIDYSPAERYALDDIPEHAWLGDDFVDAGATSATRQSAYDNQGSTPVDVTNNAILDLEGAGLYWEIRDDLEATLFRVTDGSAGGTSEVTIDSAVDLYDNNAVDVDFNAGISANSGGSRPVDVGVNDGLVETTAGDLEVKAAGELILNDTNMVSEATWTGPGVKVSETTTEVTDYETAFGGEVSLMNAVVQAYNHGARGTKIYANVTSTTVADTDVGGVGGGANLDAQLPDMSGGTFITDYDVFLNGELLRGGVDAAANNDYYPGTSLANGQLKFEFIVKTNDVICVIPYA